MWNEQIQIDPAQCGLDDHDVNLRDTHRNQSSEGRNTHLCWQICHVDATGEYEETSPYVNITSIAFQQMENLGIASTAKGKKWRPSKKSTVPKHKHKNIFEFLPLQICDLPRLESLLRKIVQLFAKP